jgi:L-2-hydroxyglutarate oxidase LhgO
VIGKFVVATCPAEEVKLGEIFQRGQANGVENIHLITGAMARSEEPQLRCSAALYSQNTGIIDSYSYMLALLGDAEAFGATIAYEAPIIGGAIGDDIILRVGGQEPFDVTTNSLIIAAGLSSCDIAQSLGLSKVPHQRMCKGNYFSLSGRTPFSRLIYPVPVSAGLGIHYTLDMQNRARFGPDVEWIDTEEYSVDPNRSLAFFSAIERYWPEVRGRVIEPAYCGIRPKIFIDDFFFNDFLIGDAELHGHKNVVALYGIESPGLTSSLAIAELVAGKLR